MIPHRTEHLPAREIDGRAVIVHPRQGQVHELDPIGTFLWNRADGTRTLDEIAAEVAAEFEVTADEASRDAREFFENLEDHGLIRWATA